MEFKNSGGINKDEVAILTNRFRGILVNTERFEVVEREQMENVLKEQNFSLSDNCSQECAVQVGQLLGVKQMIGGTIGKLGQTWTIDLRMIDVGTGKILQNMSRDYKGEIDGLLDVMKSIAAKFSGMDEKTVATEKSGAVSLSLSQWEILGGTWYEKDGAIFGSGGHLIYKEPMADYVLEITVEKLSGPAWAAMAVCTRSTVFLGGTKIFRNNTSDLQGYGFNFTSDGRYNLYSSVNGGVYLINPSWKECQKSDMLNSSINSIRIEVIKDNVVIVANGKQIASFTDGTHGYGAPCLWVQEPSQIVRFSNFKITIK